MMPYQFEVHADHTDECPLCHSQKVLVPDIWFPLRYSTASLCRCLVLSTAFTVILTMGMNPLFEESNWIICCIVGIVSGIALGYASVWLNIKLIYVAHSESVYARRCTACRKALLLISRCPKISYTKGGF